MNLFPVRGPILESSKKAATAMKLVKTGGWLRRIAILRHPSEAMAPFKRKTTCYYNEYSFAVLRKPLRITASVRWQVQLEFMISWSLAYQPCVDIQMEIGQELAKWENSSECENFNHSAVEQNQFSVDASPSGSRSDVMQQNTVKIIMKKSRQHQQLEQWKTT